jgi:membrane protein required for colicin V production
MPSYLDLTLIAVVLISALLSMLRGFTREVLAIASWAAAAAAAYYFYPLLLPYLKPYISKDQYAIAASAAAVFIVTLVIVSIITVKISDAILDSKIGALDRSLGFLFGAGRGYLLCVIAFVFFAWLVPEKSYPSWVQNSKTRSWLEATGTSLQAMLPENLDNTLSSVLKKQKGGVGDDLPPEVDPAPPNPTPAPRPGQKTEAAPPASGLRPTATR